MSEITFHMFANGFGLVDLPNDWGPSKVKEFRDFFEKSRDTGEPMLFFQGVKVRVVEHPMPFGQVELDE